MAHLHLSIQFDQRLTCPSMYGSVHCLLHPLLATYPSPTAQVRTYGGLHQYLGNVCTTGQTPVGRVRARGSLRLLRDLGPQGPGPKLTPTEPKLKVAWLHMCQRTCGEAQDPHFG